MANLKQLAVENAKFLAEVKKLGGKKPKTKFEVLQILGDYVKRVALGSDKISCILKQSSTRQGIAGIASAKMYDKVGINTPQMHGLEAHDFFRVQSLQQDVNNLPGLEVVLAQNCLEYQQITKHIFGKYKWQIFYDTNLRNAFLNFMTEACLEQMENFYLAGELRTDSDATLFNFFLYRPIGAKKYTGIIAIDLEQMQLIPYVGEKREEFDNFIYYNYRSATPQQAIDSACYASRLNEIKQLLQDGVLSEGNVEIIKKILKHNFPKEVEDVCAQLHIQGKRKHSIVDPVKWLWDYNNNEFNREL